MWIEELPNGKFKYTERYVDPLTEKNKKVSMTLTSNSRRAWNQAQRDLNEKIESKLIRNLESGKRISDVTSLFWDKYPHTVKATTARRARQSFNMIEADLPGNYLLEKIDTPYLQKIVDTIYYEKDYSLSTTKQVKYIINQIFTMAKKQGFIKHNPALEIEIKPKPVKHEDMIKIENKYLEKEELRIVIDNLRNVRKRDRYADFTEFLALTGLRFGECIGIRIENVNGSIIDIDGTIDYLTKRPHEAHKTTTKNGSSYRKITLQKRPKEILDKVMYENQFIYRATEKSTVFCNGHGYPIELTSYNRMLKNVAKDCNINKNLSSHIFRHTNISLMAELGVDLKTVMARVGHSKPETTLKIYTHVTDKMNSNMIEKLDSLDF